MAQRKTEETEVMLCHRGAYGTKRNGDKRNITEVPTAQRVTEM